MTSAEDRGIERFKQQRDAWALLGEFAECSEDPSERHTGTYANLVADYRDSIVRAHEEGKPFIADNYCTAPEIAVAMDLPAFTLYDGIYLNLVPETLQMEIDATAAMGLTPDLCTLLRSAIYCVENGLLPVPAATVGILSPCDGMPMLQQVVKHSKHWGQVPWFCPDPPYFKDDRSINYFANEIRKIVTFLEESTGRKLDLDRLKSVVEESNQHYLLWQEYTDLRRAVPCPHGFAPGGLMCFAVAQMLKPGQRVGTDWFAKLVEIAEEKVKQGLGAVEKERVRIYWFDLLPGGWTVDFVKWLEDELGAVVVMDFFGLHPYTVIDTSDENEIWRGLAKRGLYDTPMIRQALGPAEGFVNDLQRVINDFRIDVVAWPGHMGHKEAQATVGLVREKCRELGVPFLEIGMDIFDGRYTTADQIKDKFSQFLTGVGLI
jgi:hypothetical protein